MESKQTLSKLRKNNSGSEEDRKMVTTKRLVHLPHSLANIKQYQELR